MFKYLEEAFGEFGNIRWLSFRRAAILTIIVIIFTLLAAFLLGLIDNLLSIVLKGLIN